MFIISVLIIACLVLVIFFMSQKKNNKLSIIREKVLSRGTVDGVVKVQVVEQLVDTTHVKRLNAEKIISEFGKPQTLEQKLIINDPTGFIYFARFFDARIRYGETKPEYISKEDHYRPRYEAAHSYGLAFRGYEIPTVDILRALRLRKELNRLSDKSFTRIKEAVEQLSQLPDIDRRIDQFTPRINYFQLKNIHLDMEYLEGKWEIIDKT